MFLKYQKLLYFFKTFLKIISNSVSQIIKKVKKIVFKKCYILSNANVVHIPKTQ